VGKKKPEGKRSLGRPRRRRHVILNWILKIWDLEGCGMD
jgi:hypothetical protein